MNTCIKRLWTNNEGLGMLVGEDGASACLEGGDVTCPASATSQKRH